MRNRYGVVTYLGLAALAVGGACKSGSEPATPVPTTVVISPAGALSLVSVGASQQLSAQVLDQNGTAMPSVAVTWSTSNGAAATVSASGIVTAVANGTATITATATGTSVSAGVSVTVAQAAAALVKTGGDAQTGAVGLALGTALGVRANDALGNPVAGVAVAFAVTAGGGSVGTASATTNASGVATSTWTLGTTAGAAQGASATAAGLAAVTFTATATAGAAAAMTIQAGNNQAGTVSAPLAVKPSVKVTDSFGNAKPNVNVQFSVTGGGGSIANATQTTDAQGIATAGDWTLGAAAGANSLSALVVGTSVTATFSATGQAAGAPANMVAFVGDNQTALRGFATNIRPAVKVTDAGGGPVAGVSVSFAVMTGGGSVTGASVMTNALGIAQVGSWVVGATPGSNAVQATSSGLSSVTFTATGAAPMYSIDLRNIGPTPSAAAQAAFDSAKARWERIIYGDQPDLLINIAANACGVTHPAINETVDDMLIMFRIDSIDGPGAILGQAGGCVFRSGSGNGLFAMGLMIFDSADVASPSDPNRFTDVVLHEMGHVLGFSAATFNRTTSTVTRNCLQMASAIGNPLDTHFNCPITVARFDSIGGTSYTGGNKVPIENCGPASPVGCGSGQFNSHWREPTFGLELMTPYRTGGAVNPLSILSITVMEDVGYLVNYAEASPYSRTFTAPAAQRGRVESYGDDELRGPVYGIDRSGRIVTVIPARRP